jgi:putative RNA 2'-phosphotransferase
MKELIKKSKYLTKLLRHEPEDLEIDKNGWTKTKDVIRKLTLSFQDLEKIVETNDKNRFSFDIHKQRIRANQGHSIDVDVELKEIIPPHILYHGTSSKYIDSIYKTGLDKRKRNYVHLSKDIETRECPANRRKGWQKTRRKFDNFRSRF